MSDVIETLDKNIKTIEMLEKEYAKRATPRMKYASIRSALNNAIISLKKTKDRYSEERAKESQECNSDLISRKKLIEDLNRINSEYYPSAQVSRLMECVNNQPQILVQDSPKLVQESDCISRKLLLQELETDTEDKFGKEWFKYMVNNQPQVQPIANDKTKLKEKLIEYFDIGDSSAYYLTRVKESFSVGTMTLDDFVEFTENDIDDLVDYLTKKEV